MSHDCIHLLFRRCISIALSIITILMVVTLYHDFLNNPTLTSLEDSSFPVMKVPFPGISVCSVNKISKKKAENLAKYLANVTNKSQSLILRYIRFIGQLYDFDFIPSTVDDLLKFQEILDNSGLKLADVIADLAIPCKELLANCMWQRKEVNCLELFETKMTSSGYCCVLSNYNKSSRAFLTTEAGIARGLQITMKNLIDDYFYSVLSSTGVAIQIFDSNDYPDKPSGSMHEILIENNTESFIEISPTTFEAVADITDYPVAKRNCLFGKESPPIFGNEYSQSNCLIDCRIESVLALCKCIPFKMPLADEDTMCTTEDIPCLHRFKDKWFTISPYEDVQEYLLREQHESLSCSKICYPRCDGTLYDVHINSFPILNKTEHHLTVAYIYYGTRFSNLYKTDVYYYWFEILSNFGGLFGLFLGFSVISLLETVIYISMKIVKH